MNMYVLAGIAISAMAYGQQVLSESPLGPDIGQRLGLSDSVPVQLRDGDNSLNTPPREKNSPTSAPYESCDEPSALSLGKLLPPEDPGLNLSVGSEGVKAIVPW